MMNKKRLIGLGLGATIIALIVLYFFYPGGAPRVGPGKPEKPEIKYPSPELKDKTPPAGPMAPAPQEQAKLPLPEKVSPPEKSSTKPELSPAIPGEEALPKMQPEEKYGLLIKSYKKYWDAGKMMQKLQEHKQPAFIRRDKGKYEVWVGPFSTHQEAEVAGKSLRAKFKLSPKVQKLLIPVPK